MPHKIIKLLMDYELTLSELYGCCARTFPDHRGFFSSLSEEEVSHASRIDLLASEAEAGFVEIDENAFAVRPLEISIEHAKEVKGRVEENKINLLGVLSLAYDIESSLIESEYHMVFKGDSMRFNETIHEIHMESEKHRRKILQLRDQLAELSKPPILERWD
jgi:hypothetical protein